MLIGAMLIGFTVFTRSFISVPEDTTDFLKGMGVAFIISAFILDRKRQLCITSQANKKIE
jgi:hypothetical protein